MFGRDIRRLRPNVLIGGVAGMAETLWKARGCTLLTRWWKPIARGRCVMTTVDQDTLERDPEVLREIGRRSGGRLALNADVVRGGTVRVGDHVFLDHPRRPGIMWLILARNADRSVGTPVELGVTTTLRS